MPSATTAGAFVLTCLVLALTPGPDMVYIATRSLAQGRIAGVVSALGVHVGVALHVVAAALGVSAVVAASPAAFDLVRYAGALYLVYLGIRTLRTPASGLEVASSDRRELTRVFWQGVITNLLNAKVILFFLAFLPQFVDPSRGSAWAQLLFLGTLLIAVTLPVNVMVGILGGSLGSWMHARRGLRRTVGRASGTALIAVGLLAAVVGGRR